MLVKLTKRILGKDEQTFFDLDRLMLAIPYQAKELRCFRK